MPRASFIAPFEAGPAPRAVPFAGAVRVAVAGDVADCAKIAHAVRGGKPEAWLRQLDAQVAAQVAGQGALTVVACEDDRVVGYASASHQSGDADGPAPSGYYLMGVTTDPGERRRGVGRALTAARLEWIGARAREAWYFANADNAASIALHREFGFEEVARGPSFCGVPFTGGEGILFRTTWLPTTHQWAQAVDAIHLADVRRRARELSHTGVAHLVCEVLAYADDEAAQTGRIGHAQVLLEPEGWISVIDDGRGTDTRADAAGRPVRKPVMATKDLRFFDAEAVSMLPDGCPRRGMSVVAGLSYKLVHINCRADGSWWQAYHNGVPIDQLAELPPTPNVDPATHMGTTVRFLPDRALVQPHRTTVADLSPLVAGFTHLVVQVIQR